MQKSTILCAQPRTLIAFWACIEKLASTCFQTGSKTHACGSYICKMRRYLLDRYLHLCFCFQLHYYEKILACSEFSYNLITRGNSITERKNGYAKTHIIDFPGEGVRGRGFYNIAISPLRNFIMNQSFFTGGKLLSDRCQMTTHRINLL